MYTFIAFGIGVNFYSFIERLDQVCKIAAFCDNNSSKWGQYLLGDQRICINPEEIQCFNNPFIIIMSERENSIQAIEKQCDKYGVPHQRVYEFLEKRELKPIKCQWPQLIQRRRIHKFIELLVHGTTECNFHCEYCYVWRKKEFTQGRETSEYTPKEIRHALSMKKLGGPCHINACALGETLLSKNIVDLTYELLEEGHYLSIITNGTITPRINAILQFPDSLLERMFFKLSFHYAELKRANLLDIFWENVKKIRNSPCSYSIEITPCDSLIEEIDTVKEEFLQKADGVMPHITFTRDTNKEGLDLLSELSLEEYKNIWSTFHSDLFELKCVLYKKKIHEFCYAGNWSYRINVVNGNLQSCYQKELKGTIFDDEQKVLPLLTVGHTCSLDYCFNNHAFLTWGDAPEISCSNYLKVRDRVSADSTHWVKEHYAAAMSQKLYDNNFDYQNRWPDYERLFASDRQPAFILFNSPDYGNLGDHAIAYAERKLFQKLFPEIEFIEISCEQYIKENLLIQNVIQDEDVLIINGGGYIGSLWLWLEDLTKNIVEQYKNNKIIIFPQTLYFENSSLGKNEKDSLVTVFNGHKDLTIMLRDAMSYQSAVELLHNEVKKLFIPDIALTLRYEKNNRRSECLLCIREDKESNGWNQREIKTVLQKKELEVQVVSTVLEDGIYLSNREEILEKILDKFSSAEIVITDRLHAMIFCLITNTPCIILENISGKMFGTWQWLEGNSSVVICKKLELLEECIRKVREKKSEKEISFVHIYKKFEELEKYLKESCFV
ncbi:MAG: hypothetical protein HFI12_08070 [Lachnospiraceae bacterium]|jgi:exopolysaccharide biosynthesis predicted pyruvyltransferase EpsI/organic radical activating enzyme|nr:hypothetical protein [Lachnospiraceae bacterium]